MNPVINIAEIELAKSKLQEDPRALIDLQPLPAVAMKVNQACRDTNVDLRELARLVESDPAFAVEILSVVNYSPLTRSRLQRLGLTQPTLPILVDPHSCRDMLD